MTSEPTRKAESAFLILILSLFVFLASCALPNEQGPSNLPVITENPKNIILFIGDGMGPEQVKAAGYFANGAAGTLSFESLPYQGEVTTASATLGVTDSAAAATAMATGTKVYNGVISQRTPGDGGSLETLLELAKGRGLGTGLVTTTYMTHATPAAFGAHTASRSNLDEIAADYLTGSMPDVLLGGGANSMTPSAALLAGYAVVGTAAELISHSATLMPLSGQFGDTNLPYEYDGLGNLPHLTEMVTKALDMLSGFTDGFFLMAEGGKIDHAGHINDLARNIYETIEFSNAVEVAVTWAESHPDTVIVVTADHETGGLTVIENNGIGVLPTVTWSTGGHTGVNVPVYASGPGGENFVGVVDNTDVYHIIKGLISKT
ncbi:MAG: alkaline phosphatase [Spirochaetales bacterium]|nr:alkaline phosphatase [Spirochaetales bacterium]